MNFLLKRTFSKASICPIALILFIGFNVTNAKAQKTDYSGTWVLNQRNTDFGNLTKNSAYVAVKVIQDNKSISFERFYNNDVGQKASYTEKIIFDGPPVESVVDKTNKKATISWSADNKVLTELADYTDLDKDGAIITSKGIQVWFLSADGKNLTCKYSGQDKDKSYHASYVYDKGQ